MLKELCFRYERFNVTFTLDRLVRGRDMLYAGCDLAAIVCPEQFQIRTQINIVLQYLPPPGERFEQQSTTFGHSDDAHIKINNEDNDGGRKSQVQSGCSYKTLNSYESEPAFGTIIRVSRTFRFLRVSSLPGCLFRLDFDGSILLFCHARDQRHRTIENKVFLRFPAVPSLAFPPLRAASDSNIRTCQ